MSSSSAGSDPSITLSVIALLFGSIALCALLSCVLKRRRLRELARGLDTPLIDRVDAHRLDAALLEAEAPHHTCARCGFENFHSATACCICGESLTDECSTDANASRLTTRQQRTRERKEWTRWLDADGNLTWCRDTTVLVGRESADQPSPGFVVRLFEAKTSLNGDQSAAVDVRVVPTDTDDTVATEAETRHRASKSDNGDSSHTATAPASRELVTVEERARELEALTATTALELVDASAADPTLLSLEAASDTSVSWLDVLAMSVRPFPAKHAHVVATTAALIVPASRRVLKLTIRRACVLEDSIEALAAIPDAVVRSVIRVAFADEIGVDAGGLQREWFVLLTEKLAAPSAGVFTCTNHADQTLLLNPQSEHAIGPQHLVWIFATGRLVGRALLEGHALGFHLSLSLLKTMLGLPLSLRDLAHADPELHRNLRWLETHEGVDALGLDFSVTEDHGDDTIAVVDLVPNGRVIDVTDENKHAYIDRRLRYVLVERVQQQLAAFLCGFYQVIPHALVATLDAEELDFLLCGSDAINVDDWMAHTRYSSAHLRSLPAVMWFWEIVREMPNAYRQRLLHFATGSSRVPVAGFRALTSYDGRLSPFSLKGVPLVDDGYLWSHACFNRLDLPLHTDRAQLRAVLYATLDTDMYGFTTA